MYKRQIEKRLELELDQAEVTVITGPRRVGKTTLMQHLFDLVISENKIFLDLENVINRKIFEQISYENVLLTLTQLGLDKNKKMYVFLDEIQYVPNSPSVIKYLYDKYAIKFIVSGSSSYYLKNHFTESLAGRKIVFEIFPLTFDEFLIFKEVDKKTSSSFPDKARNKSVITSELYSSLFQEYVDFGGFPGVVLQNNRNKKKELLLDIFNSYFQKDVATLSDFSNTRELRDLMLLLITRIGNKLDINKLALHLGISRQKVYSYLEFLESTYFVQRLSKWSSADRMVSGGKKIYFCDTGLARVLAEVSSGQLFENSVFQNLRPRYKLNYYQSKSGGEIDFILDKSIGLEVKQTASKADIANMKKRTKGLKLEASYVVAQTFSEFKEVIMPWDL